MEGTNVVSMPRIGEKAPEFKAVTTQGDINFPSDYKGSWVILFSHPADFTPVCTSDNGIIRTIIYYPLSMGRNFDELYRVLVGLQTADAFSVALPADWRPGDDVIVPTAGSCGTAKERMESKGEMTCYDWFFCTKKLDKEKVFKTVLKK